MFCRSFVIELRVKLKKIKNGRESESVLSRGVCNGSSAWDKHKN
jgi:hypothetical protein